MCPKLGLIRHPRPHPLNPRNASHFRAEYQSAEDVWTRAAIEANEIHSATQATNPQLRYQNALIYDVNPMFEAIRKHQYTLATRLLLILLIGLMTIFFGTLSAYFARVKPIATVDCHSVLFVQLPGCQQILADDVDRESNNIRNTVNNIYGKSAPAMLQSMNVRETAVEQLVQARLIDNEAKRLGLQIGDDELEKTIETQAAFQTDGQFDVQRYRAILAENNLEPSVYEGETRDAMLSDAVRNMVTAAIQVSNDEAHRAYDSYAGKVNLAYIKVPYSNFEATINPSDQDVAKFYNDHRAVFREPERVKVVFVRYDPTALASSEMPSDQQIQDYYDQNLKTEFTHPAQVRARHILLGVNPGADSTEKAAAKAKAQDILNKVKAGGDFAALAKQYSDDPGTKDKGGELGFFGAGELVKPFEDVAFSLKPGEYGIAETQYGFHLIQVEESKSAHVDTPEDTRSKIVDQLRRKNGQEIAKQFLQQDLTAALTGHTLDDVAKKRGLTPVATPFFASNEPIRGAETYPQFAPEALKLKDGEVRALTEGPEPYLVKLIARDPSHIPALADIKELVRMAYIRVAAEKKAHEGAADILKQLKTPGDLNKLAAQAHLTVANTGDIPRASKEIPGVGQVPGLMAQAATRPKLPGVIDQVMESDGNSFIFEVSSRTPPDPDQWKIQGPAFTKQMLEQRRAAAWINFVDGLKSQADVVIHSDLIGATPS
jgi:peptidyl-prolyl cis-trans isomerase D